MATYRHLHTYIESYADTKNNYKLMIDVNTITYLT